MKMVELFAIKSLVENRTSLATHGICGLQNMQNTCYLNCILQCIRYNPYLYEYLRENFHTRHLNQDTVSEIHNFISAWRQLLCDFWDNNECVIQPVGFFKCFQQLCIVKGKKELIGFRQNDAEEFMQFFIDSLHEAIRIKIPESSIIVKGDVITPTDKLMRDYCEYYSKYQITEGVSPIKQQYGGMYCSTITNSYDDDTSNSFDPFVYVNLVIDGLKKKESILNAFEQFTKPEKLDGYKSEDNPKPSATEFHKKISFISLPENLIVVLKRFSFDMRTGSPSKVNTVLSIPTYLDMAPYCVGYENKHTTYSLNAICNHTGGIRGGHYYAYVKNITDGGETDNDHSWILYNDSRYREVKKDVMNKKELFSADAYILFYHRIGGQSPLIVEGEKSTCEGDEDAIESTDKDDGSGGGGGGSK
jgi:ubiquitin carboxyl-terminal hydrolase 8